MLASNAVAENSVDADAENSRNYVDSLSMLDTRALKLLGSGLTAVVVASAVGTNESYISQLVSVPEFAAEVAKLRSINTQKYIDLDGKYDSVEEKLVKKLEDLLPLMMRPMEILRAIQVINGAKRKTNTVLGEGGNNNIGAQVVQLTLPSVIVQKFTVNISNQVVTAGSQTLVTANSVLLQQMASPRAGQEVIQQRVRDLNVNERSKEKELDHECSKESTN